MRSDASAGGLARERQPIAALHDGAHQVAAPERLPQAADRHLHRVRLRRGAGQGLEHGPAQDDLASAAARGDLDWAGFVPGPEALRRLDGALAGLSPLHDVANFRPSMPTKVVEYLAHGIPVVTTPLPLAVDVVTRAGAGRVVPFGDVDLTLAQLLGWAADPGQAAELGSRGHELARRELDWRTHAGVFVDALERAAASAQPGASPATSA